MNDARAARRSELRKAVLQLFLGVLALDAVALAVYYLAHIDTSVPKTRMTFTVVWTVSTLLVVGTLLRRVRKLRYSR